MGTLTSGTLYRDNGKLVSQLPVHIPDSKRSTFYAKADFATSILECWVSCESFPSYSFFLGIALCFDKQVPWLFSTF